MQHFGVLVIFVALSLRAGAAPSSLLKWAEDGRAAQIQMLPATTNWNEADAHGETALIKAVGRGHSSTVRVLIAKKVALDQKDEQGNTALFYAVSNHDVPTTMALLKAGASVELTYGPNKESLLFEAARVGARDLTAEILKRKKNLVDQPDTQGRTPLFVAVESAQSALALDLIQAGASVRTKTSDGQTLADVARRTRVKKDSPLGKKLFD